MTPPEESGSAAAGESCVVVGATGTIGRAAGQRGRPGGDQCRGFNLLRQLSLIYGPRGVTTHTLSPGPADTPRLRSIAHAVADESGRGFDEVWASYTGGNSLGRPADRGRGGVGRHRAARPGGGFCCMAASSVSTQAGTDPSSER